MFVPGMERNHVKTFISWFDSIWRFCPATRRDPITRSLNVSWMFHVATEGLTNDQALLGAAQSPTWRRWPEDDPETHFQRWLPPTRWRGLCVRKTLSMYRWIWIKFSDSIVQRRNCQIFCRPQQRSKVRSSCIDSNYLIYRTTYILCDNSSTWRKRS